MRRLKVLGALGLAVVACFVSAGSAAAAPTDPFVYQYSFDGAGVPRNQGKMAVNHATGNLLDLQFTETGKALRQFDSEGNPVAFPALGSSTIPLGTSPSPSLIAVDNTGGPGQGNIYLTDNQFLWSFAPDGSPLHGSNPIGVAGVTINGYLSAMGVRSDGTLEFMYDDLFSGEHYRAITDTAGQTIATELPLPLNGTYSPYAFDELGNFYAPGGQSFRKYDGSNGFADLGETGLPIGSDLVVDPSTNDLYSRQGSKIFGVHYSNPLVQSTPFEALGNIANVNDDFAFDVSGQTLYVGEGNKISVFRREPAPPPFGLELGVDEITTTRAEVHARLTPGGGPASFHFELGTTAAYGSSTPEIVGPESFFPLGGSHLFDNLQPDTTYHVRLVAKNAFGVTYGPDKVFKTYSVTPPSRDLCANALARSQTAAQHVPDCRAYELASAADTGGYDVESYLAPGQSPFPGFPLAIDKVLYATHSGAVPGPWSATNRGPDPYVSTRTANGWVTQYDGLPADINPAAGSFSSVLGEADPSLSTLAFAGSGLCSPCFGSGLGTGIPVRMPSGQLVQGMAGSLAGSVPAQAKPEGRVAKYFSADGRKLLFASKYAFEPGANTGGDLTVYERDLAAGSTEIVSTDAAGTALTGTISELDASGNGSRVVVGKGVSTDSQGNEYVHPYLHIAGRPGSVDLAPATASGVLYAGMTRDGSKAFFTTPDKLGGTDTDTSADLYEADVDSSGNLSLKLISASNSDACNPVANANGAHWNTASASADCSVVAVSGGGGVAASTGAVYFLSPEAFGGQGTPDQPNLYLATPGGSPTLVATLEPDNPLVLDSVKANGTRKTGDFQTTPSGNYAAFTSALPLTGVDYFGFRNVFRYEANSGQLICPSCDRSGTTDDSLARNAELAPNGLSLLEDGRVFFTTNFALLLSDANRHRDVYEWSEGRQDLISSGIGSFDSALLTVSADGTDAFFFTRDNLVPEEDDNGALTRIYDAREGGGFFKLPASVPCQASDECHGPSSPVPGPADIKSSGKTTPGNVVACPKNRIKHRGQCVKKAPAKKRHHRKHGKKRAGAKQRAAKTNGKRGGRNA